MADVTALKNRITRWGEQVQHRASDLTFQALQDGAPLKTGATRRGIQRQDAGLSTVFRSTTKQGEYVEEGTSAHIILPTRAKVLVFPGSGRAVSTASPNQRVPTRGGGLVFTAHVHHPGSPARPWFRPTMQRWPEFIRQAAATVGF